MVRRQGGMAAASVALLALCSAEARAEGAPTSPALHGPIVVHLNQTSQAELNFQPEATGLADLPWKVTSGKATPLNDGRGLHYSAPERHYPQVVLVGAYDPVSRAPIVYLLHLVGAPTVEVDSEPNVDVVVEIAGTSFGPRRTNHSGIARVPVEVPPGVDTAVTLATDSHGNVTRGELSLDPPAFPRVLALCSQEEPVVWVVEVSPRGEPVMKPSFEVHAKGLTANEPEAVSPGVFRVAVTGSAAGSEPQDFEVSATLDGSTSSCTLTTTPVPVSRPYVLQGSIVPIAPLGYWSMGAHLGWLTNGERVSGPWGSLLVGYAFSGAPVGLRAEAEFGYSQSATSLLTTDNEPIELEVRTWPLFLTARYVLDFGVVHPSAALNIGAEVTEARASGDAVLTSETFVTPWFGGAAAVWWWLGKHEVGAEIGYAFAEHPTGAIIGNVAGSRFLLDYRYIFQ